MLNAILTVLKISWLKKITIITKYYIIPDSLQAFLPTKNHKSECRQTLRRSSVLGIAAGGCLERFDISLKKYIPLTKHSLRKCQFKILQISVFHGSVLKPGRSVTYRVKNLLIVKSNFIMWLETCSKKVSNFFFSYAFCKQH